MYHIIIAKSNLLTYKATQEIPGPLQLNTLEGLCYCLF